MGPGESRVGRPSLQLDNQGRLPAEGARNGLEVEAARESFGTQVSWKESFPGLGSLHHSGS